MLYQIAHILRDQFPYIWDLIDCINSSLFSIRYGKKLNTVEHNLNQFVSELGFSNLRLIPIRELSAEKLKDFFTNQPKEAYNYFHPHGFDIKSIQKLQHNKAFLAYVLIENQNNNIVGYCFNRSFFHGKGFRGRIADSKNKGKGLGTLMNKVLNEVGFNIGLSLYETVNIANTASYKSALSASNVKIIKKNKNGELYLKILKN